MRDVKLLTDAIFDSVDIVDVAKALRLRLDKYKRCACPIHGGKDNNMRLYQRKYYKCFVCGSHGDTIDLVRKVNRCGFKDAVKWLSDEFRLGLDIDGEQSEEEKEKARIERRKREARQRMLNELDRIRLDTYLDAVKLTAELEADAKEYAPNSESDEWDARFCRALQMLPEVRDMEERAKDAVMKDKVLSLHTDGVSGADGVSA